MRGRGREVLSGRAGRLCHPALLRETTPPRNGRSRIRPTPRVEGKEVGAKLPRVERGTTAVCAARLSDAPAGHPMLRADLDQGRFLLGAVFQRHRTAGMEAAAAWGVERAGHVAENG